MLRIASVPSDHVYVRHLEPACGPSPWVRLADPPVPGAPPGRWWPSPVLEPAWLRSNAATFDLVHVHFGFEHRSAEQLRAMVGLLRSLGKPLVLTVHDLRNPHLADQAVHDEGLDVLVPAADVLITLTPGAADEIARRWSRGAVVLPHPHVVGLDRLARPRPERTGFVVGLHATRRANDGSTLVRETLADVVSILPGARLHPGHARRPTDDELWDHLASLDVLVLAYRFGTHSGFVEACHDLGTTVVAADTGHLVEQQPILTYDLAEPASLDAALRRAYDERPSWRAEPGARARQREELAAAHAALYEGAVAARAAA